MAISDEQWRTNALAVPGRLSTLNRTGNDDGLREAMLLVWSTLATASSTIKHLYSTVRESEISAVAKTHDLTAVDFGLSFSGDESYVEIVKRLGGCLRAMEIEFTSWDLGSRPTDPERWRVGQGNGSAFLIPMGRQAWREPKNPESDTRPFDQRGLLRMRFIPSIVDGATVRLKMADRLARTNALNFGAVLFPEMTFVCQETETTFVVIAVNIPNGASIIADACRSAHSPSCTTAVFPELTIDPRSRDLIHDQLAKKPWLTGGELPDAPSFVVAGSWHEIEDKVRYNIATIFDGHGEELLRHRKRFAYKDPNGRFEEIQHGTEFAILALPEALYAFGICLDFCNRCFNTPYGELDVDFVVVPSCGDDKTMSGHIRTAKDLHDGRKTRSFVVQQASPPVQGGAGFVLNPDGNAANWAVNGLIVGVPWSVFSC